jgi:methionyl-tRNA synthetase
MMNIARLGNKYLADTEPWKLKKTDEMRTQTIMNIALQLAASLSVLSRPFLPFTANKLADMLTIEEADWSQAGAQLLPEGHQIQAASLLFSKIEDEAIELQIAKLG